MSATPFTALYDPLRLLLGDRFSGASPATLDTALRLALNLGKVPGHTLVATLNAVTPAITTPRALVLTLCHAVRLIVTPDAAGFRRATRAFAESHGDAAELLRYLDGEIDEATPGRYLATWQDFGGFIRGVGPTGEAFWEAAMQVTTALPLTQLDLSAGGAVVTTAGPPGSNLDAATVQL